MRKEDIHIMFDLECLGQAPEGPIVQIGATTFDINGFTYKEFDVRIALDQKTFEMFKPDIDTIEWWLRQSERARQIVFNPEGRQDLFTALSAFTNWVEDVAPAHTRLWSHITYDQPILENAYKALSLQLPCHHKDFRDIRTLKDLAGDVVLLRGKEYFGEPHDALTDCKFQSYYCAMMMRKVLGLPL